MAKGKSKKATGKQETVSIVKKEQVLPELAGQSLGSLGFIPSRLFQNGILSSGEASGLSIMRQRFSNLYYGIMPFQVQQGFISVKEAIWLCQKAYFNVAVFRNAINTLTELCNTDIYLEGGNSQSEDFFNAWFKRINLWKLKDMF